MKHADLFRKSKMLDFDLHEKEVIENYD